MGADRSITMRRRRFRRAELEKEAHELLHDAAELNYLLRAQRVELLQPLCNKRTIGSLDEIGVASSAIADACSNNSR